jgi:hypothetical protein
MRSQSTRCGGENDEKRHRYELDHRYDDGRAVHSAPIVSFPHAVTMRLPAPDASRKAPKARKKYIAESQNYNAFSRIFGSFRSQSPGSILGHFIPYGARQL